MPMGMSTGRIVQHGMSLQEGVEFAMEFRNRGLSNLIPSLLHWMKPTRPSPPRNVPAATRIYFRQPRCLMAIFDGDLMAISAPSMNLLLCYE